ncbi:MAG TPA: hypothetical protein VFJ23_07460 [Candidatus Nitrosotalea sp.]|nr:hypothetical protein [Candidatus Nitrosotalea sp.]
MYFIRKIRKTKKKLDKSSFIVSLPKKLQRKIESQNKEISKRLENLARFRYFYDDTEGSKCFLLSLWSNEQPSYNKKTNTTTIQRSGRSSRYVLIPKKICYKYGWTAGTELVIGLDCSMGEFVHGTIYENNVTNNEQQPQVCIIKFQTYQDMKNIYRIRLEKKKEELARQERDAYWASRTNYRFYEIIDRIQRIRKQVHKITWTKLFETNLVAVPYSDFVKLRSEKEREKKRKRRKFLQKRYGIRATWQYRKDLVRSKSKGYDYDSHYENILDDPDSYLESKLDNSNLYHENKLDNPDC